MNTRKLTLIAVVAALYVVLTVSLGMLGYGPIQFRVSEILNLLALIHPIYIFAVGLGCAISNLYVYGIIDVAGYKKWAVPFSYLGKNPILVYMIFAYNRFFSTTY